MTDPYRLAAQAAAADFLAHDAEYRMGYVEAELPHPLTRQMSQTFDRSVQEGIRTLFSVDAEMADRAEKTLASEAYRAFADTVRRTLADGYRVIFSGCGSSGRLSMRVETSWREALYTLAEEYPAHREAFISRLSQVRSLMTGGDYAVIRAVEAFEDSSLLGEAQARELALGPGDLLVGVTATGETTSILGTAKEALRAGASVTMLICSDPRKTAEKMQRVREVFAHERCSAMLLDCGPMAVTGSTRMQSSTYEQLASLIALEGALEDLLRSLGLPFRESTYGSLGTAFKGLSRALLGDRVSSRLAAVTERETEVYRRGGTVTYFADEYLLDVLTDTTERAPTFMTPPFRSSDMTEGEESWAFVKNPGCDTAAAWDKCFCRRPCCISWSREVYASFGMTDRQIGKIPPIDLAALRKFAIGNERNERREGKENLALWLDQAEAPDSFRAQAQYYGASDSLSLDSLGIDFPKTRLKLFEHLAMKMILNVISTGSMALMGRIRGNWMINLAMSNKKLIDRSARIVADLCGLPYEKALEEVFYSYEYCEAHHLTRSPAGMAIERLSQHH